MAFPARLHALLASEAPVGVVFRRGPANSVCSILWNRRRDEFQVGQWLRARLYERRSDISPDGGHMIYFVGKGVQILDRNLETAVAQSRCVLRKRRRLARR